MAPTPQPTLTREQQQALAKARARARISTGGGLGATNPMVAQGQAAQREYAAAGSPELPADNTVRMPAARDPLAPRAGEEWRKIDRSAQPAPQSPFYPKETADRLIAATAEANKAKRENEEYRARRGPVINAISDFLIGGLNAGDQALYSAADAGLNAIDPERRGAKAVRESLLPFAGLRENNDIVRAIPEMAAGIAENPASGAATVVEGMEPTHMIARGGNNLRDAGRAALQGDFKEAQAQYSEATPDLLFGTLGVTPFGSMAVSAAKRGVAAPGEALRAQMGRAAEGFRQFDAPAVVEPPPAQPGPKPAQPGPSGPAPQSAPVAQAAVPQLAPAVAPSVAVQSNLPNGFFQSVAGDGYKHKAGYSPNVGVAIQSNTPSAQTTSYIRKDGGYGDARELNYVDESSLQDVWHPSNDAAKAEAVDLLNRMGGEADNARYKAMQDRLKKVVADDQAGTYAPESPASSAAPVVQPTAPQAPPRPTQPRPASTGQQPNAGNAAPGAGPAPAAAAQPVLNATPVAASISRVPADTQKILTRILKAASVPGNDIDGLSLALVQAHEAFKRSGSEFAPRVSLGRFIDQNLAEVAAKAGINLPDVTVRDVQQGLRGRGRTAHGDGDPGDRSRAIMSGTIGDLRTTQKDFARKQIEASDAFNVTAIADQKKALERNAEAIGKEAYNPTLKFAKNVWDGVEAAKPGEKEALQKLQQYLLRKPYLNAIPADLKLRLALDEIPLEKRIAQDPAGTAHWLQSKLGQAAADSTDGGMRGALGDARERLLTELDKAIPAYKNIRADYGDEFRTIKMLDAGKTFFADTLRPADTADLADLYKSGTARQKTAMRMSVRDELFTVFDGTPEDVALRLEKLTSEGRLRGLEEIFGAPGKKVADTLRFIRDESLWLRGDGARGLQGVDALSGSNTVPNALSRQNDAKAVRTGFQGAISSMADRSRIWAAMLADAALALGTGGAYHYPMMTIGAGGSKIARGLGNPSRKVMANSTEGLFGLPKQPTNALASLEPPVPKPTRKARAPKPDLPTTMRELQEAYQNASTRAERARIQKQMARVGAAETPNALSTPPGRPVKGGPSGTKLNGMGGTPEGVGAAGGATYGYFANPTDANGDGVIDDADRGLNAMGGLISGGLGVKAVRSGANAVRNAMIPQARVMAEAAAPPGGARTPSKAMATLSIRPKPKATADLPMDAASQRARGVAQGFDMDTPLFHGTAADFEAFDKSMRGKVFKDGDARQAFFFSTSPRVASGYADEAAYSKNLDRRNADPEYKQARNDLRARLKKNWLGKMDDNAIDGAEQRMNDIERRLDMGEGAAVLPVYSRLRNPYVVNDIKEYDNVLFREAIDYARENGHDGVIFKNVRDEVGRGNAGPSDVYAIFDPQNIRGKFAKFDPAKTDSPVMMNGFLPSGSGKPGAKPPANALAGPPKKPAPVLSRAAEEATRELKAARRAYNTAANKWVMKDDRELRVKPLEDRVVAAEAKLAQVLKNDARLKTIEARGRAIIESPSVKEPLIYGLGGASVLSAGILGYNALAPKERGEKPMSPKDPRWFWSTVVNDKDTMVNVQTALRKWEEWPQEEITLPSGAKVMKDVEMTGRFGKVTKDALRSWRYSRGLDPDAPMSKQDLARLLSGPKGFQSDDGSWRYGADSARVSVP